VTIESSAWRISVGQAQPDEIRGTLPLFNFGFRQAEPDLQKLPLWNAPSRSSDYETRPGVVVRRASFWISSVKDQAPAKLSRAA
jgi:hypothetical protein